MEDPEDSIGAVLKRALWSYSLFFWLTQGWAGIGIRFIGGFGTGIGYRKNYAQP